MTNKPKKKARRVTRQNPQVEIQKQIVFNVGDQVQIDVDGILQVGVIRDYFDSSFCHDGVDLPLELFEVQTFSGHYTVYKKYLKPMSDKYELHCMYEPPIGSLSH